MSFKGSQGQSQCLQRTSGRASSGNVAVAEHSATPAEIFDQRSVRLEPLPLLQLKSKTKDVSLEQLSGIHRVGRKNSGIFRHKETGLAAILSVAAEISASSKPGKIGWVLEQHSVGRRRPQQLSYAAMLLLYVRESLGVLYKTARLFRLFTHACCHVTSHGILAAEAETATSSRWKVCRRRVPGAAKKSEK
jgi:hypothetical protein